MLLVTSKCAFDMNYDEEPQNDPTTYYLTCVCTVVCVIVAAFSSLFSFWIVRQSIYFL